MKRSPLKRTTSLRRRSWMPRFRKKQRRSGRVLNEPYLAWVRSQPCLLARLGGCRGKLDPDHLGLRPYGRRADDDTAIPLCREHHDHRQFKQGSFKGWSKEQMRIWCDAVIAETQARARAQGVI